MIKYKFSTQGQTGRGFNFVGQLPIDNSPLMNERAGRLVKLVLTVTPDPDSITSYCNWPAAALALNKLRSSISFAGNLVEASVLERNHTHSPAPLMVDTLS